MTRHRSLLYGLSVDCNVALPCEVPMGEGEAGDVVIHLGVRPDEAAAWGDAPVDPFHRSEPDEGGTPALVADRPGDGAMIRLTYAEGIRFHVRSDGGAVWGDWDAPLTVEDAVTFLLGPVLGLALRQRGVIALHASAVVVDGSAWGFVGEGGTGKSTLATAMARAGHPVVTDDLLALRKDAAGWWAAPSHDHMRLWEGSPALGVEAARALPALSPVYAKRALHLERSGLARTTEPTRVAGWFELDEASPGDPPRAVRLDGTRALRALVRHSYVGYLMDVSARATELSTLADLARSTAAFRLAIGDGPQGLAATVEVVEGCIRRLQREPADGVDFARRDA